MNNDNKDVMDLNQVSMLTQAFTKSQVNESRVTSLETKIEKIDLRMDKGFLEIKSAMEENHKALSKKISSISDGLNDTYVRKDIFNIYIGAIISIAMIIVGIASGVLQNFISNLF